MGRYYKRDGTAVETWSEIPVEDLGFHVGDTMLDNTVTVTTVFTGFNLGSDNEPKIFETLVHGGYYDGSRELYFKESDATEGHNKWVKVVSMPLSEEVMLLGNLVSEVESMNPYKIAEHLINSGKIEIKR